MSNPRTIARAVAAALLDGEWAPAPMLARAESVLAPLRPSLVVELGNSLRRLLGKYPAAPVQSRDALAKALLEVGLPRPLRLVRPALAPVQMGRRRWPVPSLGTVAELASFLRTSVDELEAYARVRREGPAQQGPAAHYRYRWLAKQSGGLRLLEIPKPRLRELQRRILHGILDLIPAHAMAHGFTPGKGLLGFVAPHTGRALLLRIDLESFFTSIQARRVFGIFFAAGYPEEVARRLTAICTHRSPRSLLGQAPLELAGTADERWRIRKRLEAPHLPQGAPTSPALANLAAYRLDLRLAAASRTFHARYTRYADDLAFSFDAKSAAGADRFQHLAAGIALDEGFAVQFRKTRFSRSSAAQRLAGMVLNAKPNLPREELDRLKAILHRAAIDGPDAVREVPAPNLRAHLAGRIAWVAQVNPARAEKLKRLYAAITWNPTDTQR